MRDQILIISNPPQGECDAKLAASAFGLSAAEVRMKANYSVPEVWFADRDTDQIEATAQAMRLAGLKLVVLPGEELVLPARSAISSFSFASDGLTASIGDSELQLSFDTKLIAVHCQPRRDATGSGRGPSDGMTDGLVSHRGSAFLTRDSLVGFGGLGRRSSSVGHSAEEHSGDSSFLDLYFKQDGEVVRFGVLEGETDFAGLGAHTSDNARQNVVVLADELERRFVNAKVDRRLVDMVVRSRPMVGTKSQFDAMRRGFSFATEALSQLLGAISPGLEQLTQFELSSRLAYLTQHYS